MTVEARRGLAWLRSLPPTTPFRERRPNFLQVASRVKGEPLRDAFFRSWMAGKKPPQAARRASRKAAAGGGP